MFDIRIAAEHLRKFSLSCHSLNHTLCHPEFLAPQMQMWPPHWPPQTAAARNAPDQFHDTPPMKRSLKSLEQTRPIDYTVTRRF